VRTPRWTAIVDTCCGNHKHRPRVPLWNDLNQPYLENMRALGVAPEEVDFVMCTHLHVDHVGWNTRLLDGRWVPTFPNARYLFGRVEYDFWSQSGEHQDLHTGAIVMRESVSPVIEAGLADFVETDHRLSPELRLIPTTGHTPGHVSLVIESRGERAVITGDMIHHPCQIPNPGWALPFDSDSTAAVATRERMLADWEASNTLVIGTHFNPPFTGPSPTENGERCLIC